MNINECNSSDTEYSSFDLYTASDSLPRTLMHSDFANSYSVSETSFQKALGISKERWNWLEEDVSPNDLQSGGPGKYPGCFGPEYLSAVAQIGDKQTIKRPEHEIFGLAMLGGGKITGVAHLYGTSKESSKSMLEND